MGATPQRIRPGVTAPGGRGRCARVTWRSSQPDGSLLFKAWCRLWHLLTWQTAGAGRGMVRRPTGGQGTQNACPRYDSEPPNLPRVECAPRRETLAWSFMNPSLGSSSAGSPCELSTAAGCTAWNGSQGCSGRCSLSPPTSHRSHQATGCNGKVGEGCDACEPRGALRHTAVSLGFLSLVSASKMPPLCSLGSKQARLPSNRSFQGPQQWCSTNHCFQRDEAK